MATSTPLHHRSLILYSVYLRAHTQEGTFRALIDDLDRIAALGTDVIWLMPIHPIGKLGKKGSLGCPYANADYRTTNPAYGTLEDFQALVEEIHARNMKCIIDVVYNHTSPDATLVREHPEFYYRKADGSLGNRIGDWTDVVDLDYGVPALWDYQIDSLRFWAGIVDGFRCDVASLVPLEFWQAARAAVAEVNPDCLWLAESVHRSFAVYNRAHGVPTWDDYALFSAFDMEYDYDIREVFDSYVKNQGATLAHYVDLLNFQEALYPGNHNKMRCLENHDNPRIAAQLPAEALESWTCMLYFLKGATLLYAGQEFSCSHLPSLFEREVFDRSGRDLSGLMAHLARVKKTWLADDDTFVAAADGENDIAILTRHNREATKVGLFSLKGCTARVQTGLADGRYRDLISGETVEIVSGTLEICPARPRILSTAAMI